MVMYPDFLTVDIAVDDIFFVGLNDSSVIDGEILVAEEARSRKFGEERVRRNLLSAWWPA